MASFDLSGRVAVVTGGCTTGSGATIEVKE
jgi:hypothetical protein